LPVRGAWLKAIVERRNAFVITTRIGRLVGRLEKIGSGFKVRKNMKEKGFVGRYASRSRIGAAIADYCKCAPVSETDNTVHQARIRFSVYNRGKYPV